jgi:hypothetical protein
MENYRNIVFINEFEPAVFKRNKETWRFAKKRCLTLYVVCSPIRDS